jgi:hypothetical protein
LVRSSDHEDPPHAVYSTFSFLAPTQTQTPSSAPHSRIPCLSCHVTVQISHPYGIAGKITALYVLAAAYFKQQTEYTIAWTSDKRHSPHFVLSSLFPAHDYDLLNICTVLLSKEFIGYIYVMPWIYYYNYNYNWLFFL